MAMITRSLITNLFTGYQSIFQQGLDMAQPQYQKVASVIQSNTASNIYGWLGQWPEFREWIGDRVIEDMKMHGYEITNKRYESTIGVKRTDIEDDNLGIYKPIIQEMGRATGVFPDQLVFSLLKGGFDHACYDAHPFFSHEHPVHEKADGTDAQGLGTPTSNALIDDDYDGDPWYVLDATRAIKPIIYQIRKAPKFVAMNREEDESVFMRGDYRYGVDLRSNVGYGFWQMAFGAKTELTLDNLWLAIASMRALTADGGRPLGIKPNMLVVPPSLEKPAVQLLQRDLFADGNHAVSNELKGRLELVVADFL